jgi:hypothetical protein
VYTVQTTHTLTASQNQHQQADVSQILDVSIRYAPGMRECYLEARVSLVRVVVLPAPLLAVQHYAMSIMSQLEAITAVITNDDSEDSKQSRASSAAANSDNAVQGSSDATAAGDHFTVYARLSTCSSYSEFLSILLRTCYEAAFMLYCMHAVCVSLLPDTDNVLCYL